MKSLISQGVINDSKAPLIKEPESPLVKTDDMLIKIEGSKTTLNPIDSDYEKVGDSPKRNE